jgi:hypothetical protein
MRLIGFPGLDRRFPKKPENESAFCPWPERADPQIFTIIGPGVFLREFDELGPNGIQVYIGGDFLGVLLGLNESCLKPGLKGVPGVGMFRVEIARIFQVYKMHNPREIAVRRFQKEMIMIPHEAIDMKDDAKPLVGFAEAIQKEVPVVIVDENGLLPVSPGGDMIESSGKFYPG